MNGMEVFRTPEYIEIYLDEYICNDDVVTKELLLTGKTPFQSFK